MKRFVPLAAFIVAVVGGGAAMGLVTGPDVWYAGLSKPSFNPPNWVFAPVWTVLYVMIAIAGWRVWRSGGLGGAMTLWWLQIALNFIWTPVFFIGHALGLAFAVILLLLGAILAFIAMTWNRDRVAALLFVPYAAWVAFASVLNGALVALNQLT